MTRVHWHNLPANAGHQAAPNNEGLRRARGELIAYLGHDDLWLPHHLEVLVAAIDDRVAIAHTSKLGVAPDGAVQLWPRRGWSWTSNAWMFPSTPMHDRALALNVGGWRLPPETGELDPDTDLMKRMATLVGPPRWVPRLTCVKFSAARRRDVYRTRPSHEQAEWLRRIREADDPERSFLAMCEGRDPARPGRIIRAIRRRLRGAPSRPTTSAEERWRANRRFKGLDQSG